MPGFGRREFMHPKSFQYNAGPKLAEMPKKYRSAPWPDNNFEVDQDNSGACTAGSGLKVIAGRPIPHSVTDMLRAINRTEPYADSTVHALIMMLYRMNVMNDIWSDNDHEASIIECPRLVDLLSL